MHRDRFKERRCIISTRRGWRPSRKTGGRGGGALKSSVRVLGGAHTLGGYPRGGGNSASGRLALGVGSQDPSGGRWNRRAVAESTAKALTDPAGRWVLEVIAARAQKAVEGLLDDALNHTQQKSVDAGSIDVWPGFAAAASARSVGTHLKYEPFCVGNQSNSAVNQVRHTGHRLR
jgi:hypothetical protein